VRIVLFGVLTALLLVTLVGLFTLPDDERPWMEPVQANIRAKLGEGVGTLLQTMTYSFEGSSAIPELRYIVGWYPDIESPERVFSVVAYRADQALPLLRRFGIGVDYQVLSTPDDWVTVSAGWRPSSPKEAVGACSEVIRLVGPRADPEDLIFEASLLAGGPNASRATARLISLGRPELSSDRSTWSGREEWDQRIGEILREPLAEQTPDGWRVELWVVEFSRATRYSCHIVVSRDMMEVSSIVADSTTGLARARERQ
jgi:hypothetical protein